MSAWSLFILWIVSTVIVVTTTMVLWFNTRAPNKPPRNFQVVVRWEGRGYWPDVAVRAMRWTFVISEAFLIAVGIGTAMWANTWIAGAIIALIGAPAAPMALFPKTIGGKVYANDVELFFHRTPRIYALSIITYRFPWRNVVEWTEHEGYIDMLYDGGGTRIRVFLPSMPAEIRHQIEGWRLGAQRA